MAVVFDLAWRHEAENGLTWRLAVPQDLQRLNQLWDDMETKLGKQDRPKLFARPVLLTLVAIDEKDLIVGAFYGEVVVDFTSIGTDRRAAGAIDELFPELHEFLDERAIRVARVLVPRRLAKGMKIILPRMREITQSFANFAYIVRL